MSTPTVTRSHRSHSAPHHPGGLGLVHTTPAAPSPIIIPPTSGCEYNGSYDSSYPSPSQSPTPDLISPTLSDTSSEITFFPTQLVTNDDSIIVTDPSEPLPNPPTIAKSAVVKFGPFRLVSPRDSFIMKPVPKTGGPFEICLDPSRGRRHPNFAAEDAATCESLRAKYEEMPQAQSVSFPTPCIANTGVNTSGTIPLSLIAYPAAESPQLIAQ